jgi:hypothetical protein
MKLLQRNGISKTCLFLCRAFHWKYMTQPILKKNTFFPISQCRLEILIEIWKVIKYGKKGQRMAPFLRHVYFFCRTFIAKIWLPQFWADFEKYVFSHSRQLYTVTQDRAGRGPVLNQHVWCGQGLKDSCFWF